MLRIFQRSGWVLLLALLAVSARAFSLWGPVGNGGDAYQTATLSYISPGGCPVPGGYIGAPKNFDEEYRRSFNVLYYGFDESFLGYFGATGASAVDQAFLIYSNHFSVSQTAPLTAYSLNTSRVNFRALALNILDVKSVTMGYLTECIGLSDPARWTWTLRDRIITGACPSRTYYVIQRNFDPVTVLPTRYVNGTLFTYVVNEYCTACERADAFELQVDPAQNSSTAIASWPQNLGLGTFFTGMTRDDMGGYRYMYRTNNYNVEGVPPNSELISGGFTNLNLLLPLTTVDLALFASQARTNTGGGLLALYPNLQLSSTSNFFVLITTTNIVGNFTNLANSALTITNTGVQQLLWATNDLALLASLSLTNDATTLSNLYPGIIVASEIPIFTVVTTTNLSIAYTNYPWSPAGSLPSLIYVTNLTTTVATYYQHTFANVVTNTFYTNNFVTTYTTNIINTQPYSVPGTFSYSVTTVNSILSNSVGGTFYILPTNVCAYNFVSTLTTNITRTTNLVSSTVLVDGTSFFRGVVRYNTNYVYVVNPVSCYGFASTVSNTPTTNFVHTFDNVITNIAANSSRVTILTTNITPCGGLLCTNITATDVITNQLSGSIYILPTNQCGLSIVSTQFVSVVAVTNFLSSVTNSTGNITNQGVVSYSTNFTVLVNPVLCNLAGGTNGTVNRQGIGRLSFIRRDFDSLIGQLFIPVTNTYTSYALVNNQIIPQVVRRIVSQPDILFLARDMNANLGERTTVGIFNTANVTANLAGPGTIENQFRITLTKTGPLLFNSSPFFVDEATSVTNAAWGYFDGTTNAPIVFPDNNSILNLESQLVLRITTTFLPDGTQTVPYSSVQLAGSGGLVPYTWSISPNSASGLPAGMTLTSGGLISGTPTAGGAGVYDVTIQMTDFAGRSIVREFVFTIN